MNFSTNNIEAWSIGRMWMDTSILATGELMMYDGEKWVPLLLEPEDTTPQLNHGKRIVD